MQLVSFFSCCTLNLVDVAVLLTLSILEAHEAYLGEVVHEMVRVSVCLMLDVKTGIFISRLGKLLSLFT